MFPTTAFLGSAVISISLLRASSGSRPNAVSPAESEGETIQMHSCSKLGSMSTSGRKKRKVPLTSRETRVEGELEESEKEVSAAVATIKALSQANVSTISAEFISAQKDLKVAKSRLHDLKRRKLVTQVDPLSWSLYPPPCDPPREADDPRFTHSFNVVDLLPPALHSSKEERLEAQARTDSRRQEALAFFEQYGFVVFSNVLSDEECAATEKEIWDYLEERTPGLIRAEATSHHLLSAKRYGLPDDQAIFTPQLVANRQSRRLYAALDCVSPCWQGCGPSDPENEAPGPNSVLVSHDRFNFNLPDCPVLLTHSLNLCCGDSCSYGGRWCIYPPTQGTLQRQTENPPVHLDICPWSYFPDAQGSRRGDPEIDPDLLRYEGDTRVRQLKDWRAEINCVRGEFGPHAQGVLALTDNEDQDGGTVVVPGFHKVFKAWQAALGSWEANRIGQRRRGCSYNFHDRRDPIHQLARRVPVRKGSLLLWNQCTVHGAVPNNSDQFRVAQFVRGVRAGECGVQAGGGSSDRATARAKAVQRELKTVMGGRGLDLLPLAPHVFGVHPEAVCTTSVVTESDGTTGGAVKKTKDVSNLGEARRGGVVEKHWNI